MNEKITTLSLNELKQRLLTAEYLWRGMRVGTSVYYEMRERVLALRAEVRRREEERSA